MGDFAMATRRRWTPRPNFRSLEFPLGGGEGGNQAFIAVHLLNVRVVSSDMVCSTGSGGGISKLGSGGGGGGTSS